MSIIVVVVAFTLRCASAAKPLFGARFEDMLIFVVVAVVVVVGFGLETGLQGALLGQKLIVALWPMECLSQLGIYISLFVVKNVSDLETRPYTAKVKSALSVANKPTNEENFTVSVKHSRTH